jgi:hypothetical protein
LLPRGSKVCNSAARLAYQKPQPPGAKGRMKYILWRHLAWQAVTALWVTRS